MNHALAEFIREHPNVADQNSISNTYRMRKWRIRDRLSTDRIAELSAAFKAGTAQWELAKRYGINIKSVRNLLREEGIKRSSGPTIKE